MRELCGIGGESRIWTFEMTFEYLESEQQMYVSLFVRYHRGFLAILCRIEDSEIVNI